MTIVEEDELEFRRSYDELTKHNSQNKLISVGIWVGVLILGVVLLYATKLGADYITNLIPVSF